jgi:hypothetical protein
MQDEEVVLLEHLGRGKKALSVNIAFTDHSNAGKYYPKSTHRRLSDRELYTPTLEDMLHTAARKTQAIFKISSYGKGTKRIAGHLCYISRRGKLELEDQDGKKISGTSSQKEIIDGWSAEFGKRVSSRDTIHLVLSTPPGTNSQQAYLAGKEFLEKEYKYSMHEYLFLLHNDTDHPHVHVVVKMVSRLGNKLDPRRAYLRRVRQEYAKICRSYGIEVEASARAERGLSGPSMTIDKFYTPKKSKEKYINQNTIHIIYKNNLLKKSYSLTSEEKLLRRNFLIRKQYIDKAREIEQKSYRVSKKK